MTPLGHLFVGFLVYKLLKKKYKKLSLGMVLLGSLLPDMDFIFVIFNSSLNAHRLFSHSLFFITALAVILGIWYSGFSFFIGGLLHLIFDTIFDFYAGNGLGVAWFWPIFKEPVDFGVSSLFPMYSILEGTPWLVIVLLQFFVELALIIVFFFALWMYKKRKSFADF